MKNKDWFVDWFDTPWYHRLYKNRDFAEAERFMDSLVAHLSPPATSTFMDLACGKGRHAAYLAAKGYEVVGADLSLQSIQSARQFESENCHFVVHDMRNLYQADAFDYVLNLFTSFGYFETDEEHVLVLENMRRALRKNGTIIIDFLNAANVVNGLKSNELVVDDEIKFEINRSIESGFVKKEIIVRKGHQVHHFYERVRLLDLSDFERLFAQAGLQLVEVFGSYDLEPYTVDSPRLILEASAV